LRAGLQPHQRAKKEKAPVADRSLLVAKGKRSLLEGAGNAGERDVQLAAEALNDGDNRNRDAGSDETVFNGRGARLVLRETCKNGLHELAPKVHTWLSERDPTAVFSGRLDRRETISE